MADPERSTIGRAIPSGSDWLGKPGNFLALDPERGETHVERPPGHAEFTGDLGDVPVVRLEDADELRLVHLGGSHDRLLLSKFGQEFLGCAEKLTGRSIVSLLEALLRGFEIHPEGRFCDCLDVHSSPLMVYL